MSVKEFYICFCGCPKDNHYYRHQYEENTIVVRVNTEEGEEYHFDGKNFPMTEKVKCGVENCVLRRENHIPDFVEHEFQPIQSNYRHIKFVLPEDAICRECDGKASDHDDSPYVGHAFLTFVQVRKQPEDILEIIHPIDEDFPVKIASKE